MKAPVEQEYRSRWSTAVAESPELDTANALRRVDAISTMVGNTPLLKIEYEFKGQAGQIFAKYESENMTGSIKDRMVIHTIRCGYEQGNLQPGDTLVEATSGNTGIALAAIGTALGHNVRIFMPEWMSHERVNLIRSFGAEIIPVSHEQGGFVGAVRMAEAYSTENPHVFLPRQFENPDNVESHKVSTAPEIDRQMHLFDETIHAFVAGVGTGGSVMGVGEYLRDNYAAVRIHPLEPANSPTLRTGTCIGHHRIQGISDEFIPSIVKLDQLDDIVDVWDGDAILMAQLLCRRLGLAVGISSGANVLGAISLQHQLGDGANVVTLLPDSNKKYLSTDLCKCEPEQPEFLTPRIELKRFSAVR